VDTLVADKLKRQWVQRVYFGNCIAITFGSMRISS